MAKVEVNFITIELSSLKVNSINYKNGREKFSHKGLFFEMHSRCCTSFFTIKFSLFTHHPPTGSVETSKNYYVFMIISSLIISSHYYTIFFPPSFAKKSEKSSSSGQEYTRILRIENNLIICYNFSLNMKI